MKVTNEMVAAAHMAERDSKDPDPLWRMRLALEAALVDVPNLEDVPHLLAVCEARLSDALRRLVETQALITNLDTRFQRLIAASRERLIAEVLEPLATRSPPPIAAEIRAAIMTMRGQPIGEDR